MNSKGRKMYKVDLIMYYGRGILILMSMILYCSIVIRNKDLVPLDEAVSKKTARKVNIITKIVVGIFFAIIFEGNIIPAIQDIPYILENKYEMVTGYAVSTDFGRDTEHLRQFIVEDENHKRIRVNVYTENVYVGDYMKIVYLPHTHAGSVLERSKQE